MEILKVHTLRIYKRNLEYHTTMTNIKNKIKELLSGYTIEKDYLKECISKVYNAGSRMPYYIVEKQNKKLGWDKADELWSIYGIPHQIFLDLNKYLAEEGETLTEKAS